MRVFLVQQFSPTVTGNRNMYQGKLFLDSTTTVQQKLSCSSELGWSSFFRNSI